MSVEFLVASAIGVLTAAGIYLCLRGRTFPVVLGIAMLSYAINAFLFSMGRLVVDRPPIYDKGANYTDPLPQALVLTAIVISPCAGIPRHRPRCGVGFVDRVERC